MNSGPHIELKNIRFSAFGSEDVKKLSVVRVITSAVFDGLGRPLPGGLYDPFMGPYLMNTEQCATCGKKTDCPGHLGHIELCTLVYNPIFAKTCYEILKMTCYSCKKIQIPDKVGQIIELQLQLLDGGYDIEAKELEIFKSKSLIESNEDDQHYLNMKMSQLEELIQQQPECNTGNTKNTESLRRTIVNTTIRNSYTNKCIHCGELMKKVKFIYKKIIMTLSKVEMKSFYETSNGGEKNMDKIKSSNMTVLADQCRDYLRKTFEINSKLFQHLFPVLKHCSKNVECPVDVFFFDVLPVTPPIVRPANIMSDIINEHPQTSMYKKIIEANSILRAIISVLNKSDMEDNIVQDDLVKNSKFAFNSAMGSTPFEKMFHAWQSLQAAVDQVWDMPQLRDNLGKGVKQIIEKKEGIIRMHMMGKRVNYAARTVITPDPYINIDEIGVPDAFAKRLSYPVPVSPWNVKDLRKLVTNGPDIHPGANFIEDEKGYIQMIPAHDEVKRESLAKTLLTPSIEKGIKIVHRHLVNGDVLLLNRQPSLHRPSIMGHKARILKGEKTFRLHYSNCKSYNADFDGDEMNAHFPQNELGRSEAYNLANVSNQYLVPKDGTPLGGLIQDHVISGVRMSMRGRFFNKEDYQQLVYIGLEHIRSDIKILPPTILKPHKLWSGKQILSTIIINVIPSNIDPINLKSKAKVSAKAWQNCESREWNGGGSKFKSEIEMSEAEIIIRGGQLLVGVLDKSHYGATPYGLVHCMYELYGGKCSTQLLTSFAKVFTFFLQREGFTLGVHDILVVPQAEKKRRKTIKKCRLIGHSIAATALDLPPDVSQEELAEKMEKAYSQDPKFRTILDRHYKSALDGYTNKINKICLPAGLLCKFPENNLQLMVGSGAKGSTVNTMQISCLLGQIELEGKRPPLMISGKSLPCFSIWENSPKSGGFIDGRFMTGIQPQDFFFHCMAGREGLIDTAVKTSRSGYLQRCLIKHLEGVSVNYDLTVRDSDNCVLQFLYGEDGMDISKAQFLNADQMSFLDANASAIVNRNLIEILRNDESTDYEMLQYKKKLRSWAKKHGSDLFQKQISQFQLYSKDMATQMEITNPNKINKHSGRRKIDVKISKHWLKENDEIKQKYLKRSIKCPDPIIAKYKPDTYFGSISERMENLIGRYVKDNPERKMEFTQVMCVKSVNSLVEPGEPVGLLAAQSIGEPSTQMTLNTFHFAGRGEMNVTLGIPRLREILMMASQTIKTPSMDIPFKQHKNIDQHAETLRLKLARITVADVLESINVNSHIILKPERCNVYTLRFNFLPHESYSDKFLIKPKQIIKYMGDKFFKFMFKAIVKSSKEKYAVVEIEDEKKNRKKASNQADDEIDEIEPEQRATKTQQDSSDEEIDEEDDATAAKLKSMLTDSNEYDEPNVDEEQADAEVDDAIEDNLIDDIDNKEEKEPNIDEMVEVKNVIDVHSEIEEYIFDKKQYLWCQVTFQLPIRQKSMNFSTLLKEVANKAVISEVSLIKRAITYVKDNDLLLKTDGINIVEMFKYNKILDLNRLYTNHVHAMANTYGIEAAAKVIVNEVKNVFNVYGITVDPRHLILIADYMTFDGTFKPLSRKGMESSASPLQQMSFESSAYFLRNATISGQSDDLNSPSSRLMVGKPCKSGTGAFSLINNFSLPNLIN